MREGTIRFLTFAAVLLLAGVVTAGGGVWISDEGDEYKIGPEAIFLDGEGDLFDLSDLEDGESRVFGEGDKRLTASRDGDTVVLERPATGDERALRLECEVGQDSCRVMTFGDDSEKVALMIQKRHPGGQAFVTLDHEMIAGEDGESTIVIRQFGDCEDCCEDSDADCIAQKIEVLAGSVHAGEMRVEVVSSDGGDLHKNVWVTSDGPHLGHAMVVTEGAVKHDLSELYDGETRIFGFGEKQVTAVREGDEITVTRPDKDGGDDVLVTCTVGRDGCHVLTYEDDPEKVAVVIRKSECGGAGEDCDAEMIHLHLKDVHEGDFEVIELLGGASGQIYIADPDGDHTSIRRLKIVNEEDD